MWAFHSGQICTAPTRVLAQRGVYDQLVAGLAGRPPGASRSATRSSATPCSARSSPAPTATASRATSASGRDEGATVVAGGERPDLEHGLLRGAHPDRRLPSRHDGRAGGDLRPGRRRGALRRRGRGRRARQRHRLRPLRLRVLRATPPGPCDVAQQLRTGNVGINTAAAQPRGALRRLQAVAASAATAAASACTPTARCSRSSGRADRLRAGSGRPTHPTRRRASTR